MRLLITGATGLIGKAIINECYKKGYAVHYLTTNKLKVKEDKLAKGFYWNPEKQQIDKQCLNGVDIVLNLAGAPISKRWTKTYKNKIIQSRVQSVGLLYRLLSENKHGVKHFCSASAIGVYPSSYIEKYDEDFKKINAGFLGKVVSAWETEVDKIKTLDITVSKVRIGIVLSKDGGVLKEMLKPIKLGFGAVLGSGKQFQSWIHIKDLSNLFLYVLENNLTGVFNAVADYPVTNSELTKAIAKQLKKPIWLPNIPPFILKLVLGEMSNLVLESQCVLNDKIKSKGFKFEFESIEDAFKNGLI